MLESVQKQQLLEKVKEYFDDAITYDREWQENAREAFDFRDNKQWDDQERDILAEERRPALTLNVVKSHVDLIMGLNEDLKKRYVATPIGEEDGFLCDILNNVVYWLYQRNDYESEEDNAYESALISGRGWVAIDYDVDEKQLNQIKITETSIPVHEVRCDPAARKKDLSDASYIIWDRWLSFEDFAIKYPKFEKKLEQAYDTGVWPRFDSWPDYAETGLGGPGHDINDESDYADPLDVGYFDSKKRQVRVCHMEYWKYEKVYHVLDPETGKYKRVNEPWGDFKNKWKKIFPNKPLEFESSTEKNVWWLQFCGEEILSHTKSPIDYPGFSIVPCFLYSDVSRRNGYHYGIVELMKDAQREINKRTSQTLNLFNQQVQPGVYAESRAFVNTDQAEQSLKESGSITWLQDGAISQSRFQERSVPTFPTAVLQMGEYAREMLRHITGINPDLLGMNDKRQEPGIVVQLRQQQGMAILKPAFKAYANLKKELFERQLRIIMSHMPTSQILKIMGEPGRYVVENDDIIIDKEMNLSANFRDVANVPYDVDAEPETNSMTQNALDAATFMEMQKNGIAVDPKVIISKTNLSTDEKVKWIEYIEAQQEAASQAAQQEYELEKMKIEFAHKEKMGKLQLDREMAMMKGEDARDKDMFKASSDQEKLKLQKARDEQTAQIKLIQIMTGAKNNAMKTKQDGMKILLDADHDRKRLLLDTVEVMAESMMAGKELEVKAVIEMYKEAMRANTLKESDERKLAGQIFGILVSAAESKDSNQTNLAGQVIKSRTDLAKEDIKAEATRESAKESAKAMMKNGGGSDGKGRPAKND